VRTFVCIACLLLNRWTTFTVQYLQFNAKVRGVAMVLFFIGFAAGIALTVYLFLGADRAQRLGPNDTSIDQADKWKNQFPRPWL
jgi:hypothetical protein